MVSTRSSARASATTALPTSDPSSDNNTTTTRRTRATSNDPDIPSPPSSTDLSIDPLSKARTLNHMNASHAEDLSLLLQHFAQVPSSASTASPELLDISLTSLTIRADGATHTIPLDPPLHTWSERRARLVAMTTEAREGLGLPPATSHESNIAFYPPAGAGIASFVGVLAYFLSAVLVFTGCVARGSVVWRGLEAVRFPGGPGAFVTLVRWMLVPMLLIHGTEAAWIVRSRLRPLGVGAGQAVWWLWAGCTFLEGVPCLWRFDERVLGKGKKE